MLVLIGTLAFLGPPAEGAYSVGFQSPQTMIISPSANGLTFERVVTVTGTSTLERVWFALRGPGGELMTYPAEVSEGRFEADIWLRFGPGTGTIGAGDNPTHFDGVIRFQVVNTQEDDTRYLSPSAYVDSHNPVVVELAQSLVASAATDREKLEEIYRWVTGNLSYDYRAYQAGASQLSAASRILETRRGLCRDYAFTLAALARAVGLEARIVYGQTAGNGDLGRQYHAWNEVRIDDRWVPVDATWDAGYVKGGSFIASPSWKYFDPDPSAFAKTHTATSYALH